MISTNKKWTFQTVMNQALAYSNFTEFAKNNQRAVFVARRDGYLNDIKKALLEKT
jgi:hypothetical protein